MVKKGIVGGATTALSGETVVLLVLLIKWAESSRMIWLFELCTKGFEVIIIDLNGR